MIVAVFLLMKCTIVQCHWITLTFLCNSHTDFSSSLLSQIVQASVDYQLWRDRRSSLTFDLRDIPLLTWVLVSVSPLVVVVVNEVVKLHEIRYEANDSRD